MSWGGDGNQFRGNKSMDGSFGSPGGFLANTSFDSPSMSQDRQKAKKNLAMMPVTVALLKNATYDTENEVCELDGIIIYQAAIKCGHMLEAPSFSKIINYAVDDSYTLQVTLVGIVTKIQENATYLAYEIDDLTGGLITVKKWIDKQETPEEYQQSQFREDTYVRLYGYVKVLQDGKKTIVAFNIARVTDFNEITYHMLSVIHASLALKKAAANANNSIISPGTGGGMQFGNKSTSGRGFGQNPESTVMTKFQNTVLEVISSAISNEGMSRNQIIQKTPGATDSNVREAVDFLSDEGCIYSTIDDDHFRSTNAS